MKLLKIIKQKLEDRKFSKTLGEKARLKDIQARAYQEEMRKLMEKRAVEQGKLIARKHIRSYWRRRKFGTMIMDH